MAVKGQVIFRFKGMNNVDDPTDVGAPERDTLTQRPTTQYTEAVDLVNVDVDNDGGIARRDGLVEGLAFQPVADDKGSRNYWAVGNTVYCSKALSDDIDERFSTVLSLDDMVTMIRRVDGGLYVGSTRELHYLPGSDPQFGEGFGDEWTLPYGVIMGTSVHVRGELVPAASMTGNCCIFATHRGVVVGGPGGVVKNLSERKVSYTYGLTGKALIREKNGLAHYLFTTSPTNPAYNVLPPILLPSFGYSTEVFKIAEHISQ